MPENATQWLAVTAPLWSTVFPFLALLLLVRRPGSVKHDLALSSASTLAFGPTLLFIGHGMAVVPAGIGIPVLLMNPEVDATQLAIGMGAGCFWFGGAMIFLRLLRR